MAPSPSADIRLSDAEVARLLDLADDAVVDGLRGCPPAPPDLDALPPALRTPRGIFVTLTVDGDLNGCIGSVAGSEPLGLAAARLARAAAFADPRLPALQPSDYPSLTIEVSLLSPLEPIPAATRQELREHTEPGVHGLVIAAGRRQAVFLPAVWQKLPDPDRFLDHLLQKAGISPRDWPVGMEAQRFTVEKLSRPAGDRSVPSRAA
jgi:AmmeMemoRadiSam system protein A